MLAACIYRPDGTVFASYPQTADSPRCPSPDAQDRIRSTPGGLLVSQHIELKGQTIGRLAMLYDLGELYDRMRIFGSTVAAVLVAAILLALMLSSRLRDVIADPISQLVSATTAVTEAPDYSVRAKGVSRDELGVLVDAFNKMLSGIQSRDRELRQALVEREAALHDAHAAREQLELITDTMAASVTRYNRDRQYTWVSRRYAEWLMRPPEEIAGRNMAEVLGPEGYATVRPYVDQVLSGERTAYQAQVRYSDLGMRWVDAVYVPTFDRDGAVDGWVAHVADITDLKQVQADLRKSNERLARSNEDLERFAFVASHDLQEPLRMITTYAQLLIRAYPAELDSEAGVFVANIVEGTRRMRSLLSDLLTYSEIGAGLDEPPQMLDLNHVIETVNQNLKAAIDESGAIIESEILPSLAAHENQIVPLFQNLIGNAIKYRSGAPPRIRYFRPGSRRPPGIRRGGQRDGHRTGIPREDFRCVQEASRQEDSRHGDRSRHLPACCGALRRPDLGAIPGRPGRYVLFHFTREDPMTRILLIEDNPADVDLLRRAFKSAEARVRVDPDGRRRRGDGVHTRPGPYAAAPPPDLVVLDLNLPKNDGVEVLQAMRASPQFSAVPVAILSSSSSPRERARLEQFHIGRFITKPPDLDEFLEIGSTLKSLLRE